MTAGDTSRTEQAQSHRPRKQSVWFVRYGLTEHPLVEDLGPYDSDIDPSEGIEHAVSIAKRIATGVKGDGGTITDDSIPSVVYASPFLRTAHTGYIVANELQKRKQQQEDTTAAVELRLEEGLWEWLIPSLLITKVDGIKTNPRPLSILKQDLLALEQERAGSHASTIAIDFRSVNPYDDSGDAGITCIPERATKQQQQPPTNSTGRAPKWIESQENLLARCATTLSRLLDLHHSTAESFCIVSHAPCDQAMAFFLEQDATTPADSNLKPWPLGGITVFSREVQYDGNDDDESNNNNNKSQPTGFGDWEMELYGNTEHMPGEFASGLKEWSLPCFAK